MVQLCAARKARRMATVYSASFFCPLCLDRGLTVTLMAEIDLDTEAPRAIVSDVWGLCEHADTFGDVDQQTLEESWRLIEAALNASRGPAI